MSLFVCDNKSSIRASESEYAPINKWLHRNQSTGTYSTTSTTSSPEYKILSYKFPMVQSTKSCPSLFIHYPSKVKNLEQNLEFNLLFLHVPPMASFCNMSIYLINRTIFSTLRIAAVFVYFQEK